jgi:hypothetical protein
MEQGDDHDVDDDHNEDQVLQFGKEERETKWAQAKGTFDRAILFCHSRCLVGVSGFRIDSRTIKRGDLDANTVV